MKRSQIHCWKSYCSEPLELIENYQQAKADNFAGWCIHHRLEIQESKRVSRQELKDKDLYYDRPASELVFMRTTEHKRLHLIGNTNTKGRTLSAETRKKIAEALRGRTFSAERCAKMSNSMKGKNTGKTRTLETKQKLSLAHKGKPTWNKGKTSCFSKETLQKKSKSMTGKLWWTNGIQTKLLKECPGEGWHRGRSLNT